MKMTQIDEKMVSTMCEMNKDILNILAKTHMIVNHVLSLNTYIVCRSHSWRCIGTNGEAQQEHGLVRWRRHTLFHSRPQ
jgi:hypothetical protein